MWCTVWCTVCCTVWLLYAVVLYRNAHTGIWCIVFYKQPLEEGSWMTEITMVTRDWTWLDLCLPSSLGGR